MPGRYLSQVDSRATIVAPKPKWSRPPPGEVTVNLPFGKHLQPTTTNYYSLRATQEGARDRYTWWADEQRPIAVGHGCRVCAKNSMNIQRWELFIYSRTFWFTQYMCCSAGQKACCFASSSLRRACTLSSVMPRAHGGMAAPDFMGLCTWEGRVIELGSCL